MNIISAAVSVRLVDNLRAKQTAWIDIILDARRWNLTELAAKAGLSSSTLTRWRNAEIAHHEGRTLSSRSIEAISHAANVRPYEDPSPDGRGMAESEGELYYSEPKDPISAIVSAIIGDRNGIDPWLLGSGSLDLAGYLPGDIVFVDLNLEPRNGDIVCAQVYDWKRGRTETIFRVFDQPFLFTSSTERPPRRPLTVDGQTVVIKGVIINSIRPRRVT